MQNHACCDQSFRPHLIKSERAIFISQKSGESSSIINYTNFSVSKINWNSLQRVHIVQNYEWGRTRLTPVVNREMMHVQT